MYDYSLWLHWKQGDEFGEHLARNKGNVARALEDWAEEFEERAKFCKKLAKRIEGKNIEADADTHHIGLYGDEKILNKLAKEGLIQKDEYEDEEDEE